MQGSKAGSWYLRKCTHTTLAPVREVSMKTHDIAALSAKILLSYYVDSDSAPFLNACHDDVVLVGPSYGHIIR